MRSPFQIDSDDVARLSQIDLPRVLNRLIRAEADLLGVPFEGVQTSLRMNDPDGGIDARVRTGGVGGRWLPAGVSAWQFKAQRKLTPAEMRKEVKKPGVRRTLLRAENSAADAGKDDGLDAANEGGRAYCLVLGGDPTPEEIEQMRTQLSQVVAGEYPGARAILLTAGDIAQWATEHPTLAFEFGRPVNGVMPVERWRAQQPAHRVPFRPDAARTTMAEEIRARWTEADGPAHLRIQGSAGVGKTRLALELYRDAAGDVLYAPDPSAIVELCTWVADHPRAHATLIVDECDAQADVKFAEWAYATGGRLRLLTVGPANVRGSSPTVYDLPPLGEDALADIVAATATALSPEQVRWVARVARGYVKLATTLALQVARGVTATRDLTSTYDVSLILKQLLPDERVRSAMEGLALVTRVGWDGDLEVEGQAIAEFIGMPWNEMREHIGRQMAETGLVAKQGRYRYVTPEILALWLAGEKWKARGRDVLGLLAQLPSPSARNALVERMAALGELSDVADAVEEVLSPSGPFVALATLNDEQASRVFSVLARGHPHAALHALERLTVGAGTDDLRAFLRGRREIVWTLERLLRYQETFAGAAQLLLRFAEAETESYANNATGVWISLFLTHLGGTEAHGTERFRLLEEVLRGAASASPRRILVVQALGAALSVFETGSAMDEPGTGRVPPVRWQPANAEEERTYRLGALALLDRLMADADAAVRDAAREVLVQAAPGLVAIGYADALIARLAALPIADEGQRRSVWDVVQRILTFERAHLDEQQRIRLQRYADSLYGTSLHDRLRRYVGRHTMVDVLADGENGDGSAGNRPSLSPQERAAALAEELLAMPETLQEELPWLTSPAAENAWFLGRRLSELDNERQWFPAIVEATRSGGDTMLLSAYLQGQVDAGADAWRSSVLDDWASSDQDALLVLDATWRGTATERDAERLMAMVDASRLRPAALGRLVYGGWVRPLPAEIVAGIVERLARDTSGEATEAALALVTQWLEANLPTADEKLPAVFSTPVWTLLERSAGEERPMLAHYWERVGHRMLAEDTSRVVRAILAGVGGGGVFFNDERMGLLRDALSTQPVAAWELLGAALDQDPRLAYRLQDWAWEHHVVDSLRGEDLLAWARQASATRSQLLAQLAKPREALSPLIRSLLIEYGPDSPVARILAANFVSGSWWGSFTNREEQLRDVARGWVATQDENESVRVWARRIIEDIEARLPAVRQWEEEELP